MPTVAQAERAVSPKTPRQLEYEAVYAVLLVLEELGEQAALDIFPKAYRLHHTGGMECS